MLNLSSVQAVNGVADTTLNRQPHTRHASLTTTPAYSTPGGGPSLSMTSVEEHINSTNTWLQRYETALAGGGSGEGGAGGGVGGAGGGSGVQQSQAMPGSVGGGGSGSMSNQQLNQLLSKFGIANTALEGEDGYGAGGGGGVSQEYSLYPENYSPGNGNYAPPPAPSNVYPAYKEGNLFPPQDIAYGYGVPGGGGGSHPGSGTAHPLHVALKSPAHKHNPIGNTHIPAAAPTFLSKSGGAVGYSGGRPSLQQQQQPQYNPHHHQHPQQGPGQYGYGAPSEASTSRSTTPTHMRHKASKPQLVLPSGGSAGPGGRGKAGGSPPRAVNIEHLTRPTASFKRRVEDKPEKAERPAVLKGFKFTVDAIDSNNAYGVNRYSIR